MKVPLFLSADRGKSSSSDLSDIDLELYSLPSLSAHHKCPKHKFSYITLYPHNVPCAWCHPRMACNRIGQVSNYIPISFCLPEKPTVATETVAAGGTAGMCQF
jgi:hypothetical protein